MSAPVPPGAPRPGNPPSGPPFVNYNPNLQRAPDSSLPQNFQNLNINQPPNAATPASSFGLGPARPPFAGQTPPFQTAGPPGSFAGPSPVSRTGAPPPPGVVPGAAVPQSRPQQIPSGQPPNSQPGRPSSAPLISQTPSFASRPLQGSLPMGASQGSFPMGAPPQGTLPIGGPPQGSLPMGGPSQGSFPMGGHPLGGRPSAPPPSSAQPSGFGSPPFSSGPAAPFSSTPRPIINGPSTLTAGSFGAPRFPSPGGHQQPPSGLQPSTIPMRAPIMRSVLAGESIAAPGIPSQPASPFSVASQAGPPVGPPFGAQSWQSQHHQPPYAFGSAPPLSTSGILPNQSMSQTAMGQGGPMGGHNRIDPKQIPRPISNSSVIIHETRQNNQANLPPPATSEYIARDTGNSNPRYMRCTINQIPCTKDLLATSGIQLALLVQPFSLPHPSEEPIQVVDFGEGGPVRCSRCKGYINPFMRFIDQGRKFICNLCGYTDETPRDYHCNLGPDGRRRDADERPELCRGTVEFVASKEYMVRDPMPAVFFFLIDVSMNAIQTGATAAACSAISQVISDLPEGPRTFVGIATFDSTIHFYNLKRALQQPLMLIVPDIQDVYTPLQTDVIVQLSECRQHLELLLENIPTMFQSNKTADSAFGAAIKAAFLAMKNVGGKLLVFQSVLPSVGIAALSAREAEGRTNVGAGEKEVHKLLQPQDKTLKEMAIEFAEFQVSVDVFLTTQSYVDVASISVVSSTTGGQVYRYFPFSAVSDTAKLCNDLRWNVTRPQGFEAVMRVRCSQGLQVQEYYGNFCKRIPTDVDLPAIDCDKTILVTLKLDEKLQDGSECAFQCALLYTTVYGQRRIRVTNLSLPCTSMLANLFKTADLDTQFTCFLKQAAIEIPTTPLLQVREQITNHCINILYSYRKFCATVTTAGQLILPESLKLLPLYTQALLKSTGLRNDGRIDDRSFWVNYVSFVSAPLAVPLVYPRMISVHDLVSKETDQHDQSVIPAAIPLSSEHVSDEGMYLLENGIDALIYVGNSAEPQIVQQIFGTSRIDEIPAQLVLQQYDNPLSKRFNEVINEIRRQRCSYLSLKLCKKGDPSGMLFYSYMIEDKSPAGLSYVEFLVHIHRQIQQKMN
nr:transport protein Sec24 [Fagopyrum tataricum]